MNILDRTEQKKLASELGLDDLRVKMSPQGDVLLRLMRGEENLDRVFDLGGVHDAGEWSADGRYSKGAMVEFRGADFIAQVHGPSGRPDVSHDWRQATGQPL